MLCSVGMHMPSELEEMMNRMNSSQLETYNLTNNDLVKDHLRYLVCFFSLFPDELGKCLFTTIAFDDQMIIELNSVAP